MESNIQYLSVQFCSKKKAAEAVYAACCDSQCHKIRKSIIVRSAWIARHFGLH